MDNDKFAWINLIMKKKEINSSRMPVYRDAGFELYDASTTSDAFLHETTNQREPDLYIYSRYRNPTVVAAEEEIMKLEGSEWALLAESGMAAIDIAVSIFQKGAETRPWLFFTEIYGGTISFIDSVLIKRRGVDIHKFFPKEGSYDLNVLEGVIEYVKPEIIYFETISNPMLIVADAEKIISIAKRYGVKVIIDNTFATPHLWKPLRSGADIVIHSATKYLSGHGNLSAGVLCGNDPEIMHSAIEYRKFVGHMLSPDDAYRLHTQIQTFELRFGQQCINASLLADLLLNIKLIDKVWYPGLKDHNTHNEALNLFGKKGFGGMITFDFKGRSPEEKRTRRDTFIKAVSENIKLIPTLGDPHTILMPVESVWGAKYPEPGMIRLSAGFENFEQIKEIFEKAFNTIS
jgi:cystathionine beta-lyase/cystathionine gamma-synthase